MLCRLNKRRIQNGSREPDTRCPGLLKRRMAKLSQFEVLRAGYRALLYCVRDQLQPAEEGGPGIGVKIPSLLAATTALPESDCPPCVDTEAGVTAVLYICRGSENPIQLGSMMAWLLPVRSRKSSPAALSIGVVCNSAVRCCCRSKELVDAVLHYGCDMRFAVDSGMYVVRKNVCICRSSVGSDDWVSG